MKKFINKIKNTFLSGVLLFLPLFFLMGLIQKLWSSLTGSGTKIAKLLDLKYFSGVAEASIATSILVILIFYACGLLVRFAFIGNFKNWIEDAILQYIPGYLNYKVRMERRLIKKVGEWLPVLVKTNEGARPALLIEAKGGLSTVYFPNSPDTNYGEIWVVDSVMVKQLKGDAKSLMRSIQYSGKGLLEMQL